MSTANKLTRLNTTKNELKQAINLTGANITNEPFRLYSERLFAKLIDIIRDGTSALFASMPKVIGTGTDLSLKNTANAPMILEFAGNSYQKATPDPSYPQDVIGVSGNNKIKIYSKDYFITHKTETINGITFTNNGDGTFNLKGTATATVDFSKDFLNIQNANLKKGQKYKLLCNVASDKFKIIVAEYYNTVWKKTDLNLDNFNEAEFTTSDTDTYNQIGFTVRVVSGTTIDISNIKIQMVEYSSDFALNFVKQLFNKNSSISNGKIYDGSGNQIDGGSDDFALNDYIKVMPNTMYTLSGSAYFRGCEYTADKEFISRSIISGDNRTITFTTSHSTHYLRFSAQLSSIDDIQLEIGPVATEYSDYIEPISFRGIGEHRDKIFHNIPSNPLYDSTLVEGGWYKKNIVGEYHLDETLNFYTYNIDDNIIRFQPISFNNIAEFSEQKYISNYFSYLGKGVSFNQIGISGTSSVDESRLFIYFDKNIASSVAEFKEWLSNRNVIIYYVLATPTYEQITDTALISQLDALENALSCDDETNISQDNDYMPFIMNASAISNTMGGEE